MIRLDGPDGPGTTPPAWATVDLLADAIRAAAAHSYTSVSAAEDQPARTFRWGNQLVICRSARRGGDTKTRKSRRTLALPARCVEVLWQHFEDQGWDRLAAGDKWEEHGLVFSSAVGKLLDATNVRRAFRQALKDAEGVNADEWTPRELRHSFVSLLSDRGVPLEGISRLVGHSGTAVTEEVYRKQIRPVIQTGAVIMDGIFKRAPER